MKLTKTKLKQIIREEIQNLNEGKTFTDAFELPDDIDASAKGITSLEGAPETVKGNFDCFDNKLTSLKGSPKTVGGHFTCSYNKLTSLKGAPTKVGGDFICWDNKLTSLDGAPKSVKGDFDCSRNPGKFTEEDVRKVCKVGGKIYV